MLIRTLTLGALAFAIAACESTGSSDQSRLALSPAAEASRANAKAEGKDVGDVTDGSRVICRREVRTGSRFAKSICRTWDEWQAIDSEAANATADIQRRSRNQTSGAF